MRADQLAALGLSSAAIGRRVANGQLHRRYRGVYSVGHGRLSREGEFLAAVFSGGERALLGHLALAELRGLWRYRVSLIDVVVPHKRHGEPGVCMHQSRTLEPCDREVYKGIPVTSVARMLVDLGDVLHPLDLVNVIHEAEFKGLFDLAATQEAMARNLGRRAIGVLKQALAYRAAGSVGFRSRTEARFFAAIINAGLPEPLVNTRLNGEEVDLHWPACKLAVEVDGPGHGRTRTRDEDAAKEAKWREAGYEVLRNPPLAVIRSRVTHPGDRSRTYDLVRA